MTTLFAAVFALLAPLALSAQSGNWAVASYPYDVEAARQGIGGQVQSGMIPVGLEIVEDKEIWVLYVRGQSETGPNFSIHQFSSPEKLEQEMTAIIQEGWAPVGITNPGSDLYGLFIQEEHGIDGWRIHTSPIGEEEIQKALTDFHERGFTTAGVSFTSGNAWYLFVKNEGQPQELVTVQSSEDTEEAIQAQVTRFTGQGWRPAGISRLGDKLAILYTGLPAEE